MATLSIDDIGSDPTTGKKSIDDLFPDQQQRAAPQPQTYGPQQGAQPPQSAPLDEQPFQPSGPPIDSQDPQSVLNSYIDGLQQTTEAITSQVPYLKAHLSRPESQAKDPVLGVSDADTYAHLHEQDDQMQQKVMDAYQNGYASHDPHGFSQLVGQAADSRRNLMDYVSSAVSQGKQHVDNTVKTLETTLDKDLAAYKGVDTREIASGLDVSSQENDPQLSALSQKYQAAIADVNKADKTDQFDYAQKLTNAIEATRQFTYAVNNRLPGANVNYKQTALESMNPNGSGITAAPDVYRNAVLGPVGSAVANSTFGENAYQRFRTAGLPFRVIGNELLGIKNDDYMDKFSDAAKAETAAQLEKNPLPVIVGKEAGGLVSPESLFLNAGVAGLGSALTPAADATATTAENVLSRGVQGAAFNVGNSLNEGAASGQMPTPADLGKSALVGFVAPQITHGLSAVAEKFPGAQAVVDDMGPEGRFGLRLFGGALANGTAMVSTNLGLAKLTGKDYTSGDAAKDFINGVVMHFVMSGPAEVMRLAAETDALPDIQKYRTTGEQNDRGTVKVNSAYWQEYAKSELEKVQDGTPDEQKSAIKNVAQKIIDARMQAQTQANEDARPTNRSSGPIEAQSPIPIGELTQGTQETSNGQTGPSGSGQRDTTQAGIVENGGNEPAAVPTVGQGISPMVGQEGASAGNQPGNVAEVAPNAPTSSTPVEAATAIKQQGADSGITGLPNLENLATNMGLNINRVDAPHVARSDGRLGHGMVQGNNITIATTNRSPFDQQWTLAHEIGHVLSRRLGVDPVDPSEAQNILDAARRVRFDARSVEKGELPADLLRLYLFNPEQTQKLAPKSTAALEAALKKSNFSKITKNAPAPMVGADISPLTGVSNETQNQGNQTPAQAQVLTDTAGASLQTIAPATTSNAEVSDAFNKATSPVTITPKETPNAQTTIPQSSPSKPDGGTQGIGRSGGGSETGKGSDEPNVPASGTDARRALSVAGIRQGIAKLRHVELHDDGVNLHFTMPDKSVVKVHLHDRITPKPDQIKNFLMSAIASNGGERNFTARDRRKGRLPSTQGEWNALPEKAKDLILDNFKVDGRFDKDTQSIHMTHMVGQDSSIATEEVFHAQADRLSVADYNRMMKKYKHNEEDAFVAFQKGNKASYFQKIRKGITKDVAPPERQLSAKEQQAADDRDLLLSTAVDRGVLLSDNDYESIGGDTGGLSPDVMADYRVMDEKTGKHKLKDGVVIPPGQKPHWSDYALNAEGRKLEKHVNEDADGVQHDADGNQVGARTGAAFERDQQRIIDEALMTPKEKLEYAAAHFNNENEDPELRAAAQRVLGIEPEQATEESPDESHLTETGEPMPEYTDEVPFAVRKDANQLRLAGEADRETVGDTSPMFDRGYEAAKESAIEPKDATRLDAKNAGVSEKFMTAAKEFAGKTPSLDYAKGVKLAMLGRDFTGNDEARKGYDEALAKMSDGQKQYAAGVRRWENPPPVDKRDARIAKKFGSSDGGSMFAVRRQEEENAPAFFLKSEKVIGDKMSGPMAPMQVRGMLENAGVKPDEMKWIGLYDFLREHRGPVGKQELMDFIKANDLKIREVMKGAELGTDHRLENISGQFLTHLIDFGMTVAKARNVAEMVRHNQYDEVPKNLKTEATEYRSAYERAMNHNTKFSQYQLPGGENYREMLLTLPPKVTESEDRHERMAWQYAKNEQGFTGNFEDWKNLSSDERLEYEDGASGGKAPPIEEVFRSSHWDEPNVLAHVRMNDRTGPNGEKILHVEEIQSDWHQAGREKGYGDEIPKSWEIISVSTAKDRYPDSRAMRNANGDGYVVIDTNTGTPAIGVWGGNLPTEAAAKVAALEDIKSHSVPDAPFRKTWHEMALRRIIRHAAENGYKAITFTTGEQQNERYDLSRQVKSIRAMRNDEGWDLSVMGKNGERVFSGLVNTDQGLADYVGKEFAEKIINNPKNIQTYEGLDLKVGGSGMKGFYDKIIPDYLNKYGKRWGAKVGETQLSGTNPEEKGGWDTANTSVQKPPSSNTVHHFPITDSMRESVMREGQPLFAVRRNTTPAEPPPPEETGIRNAISAQDRERLGLPPRNTPEAQTFDEWHDEGMRRLQADPMAAEKLYNELRADPTRQLDPQETGTLLADKVNAENESQRLLKLVNEADKSGNADTAKIARAQLSAHIQSGIEKVKLQEAAGTPTARALAARAMISKMDHSLVHMMADATAIKPTPLTGDEVSDIQAKYTKIKEASESWKKIIDQANTERDNAQIDAEIANLKLRALSPDERRLISKPRNSVLKERVSAWMDDAADSALKRIKERQSSRATDTGVGTDNGPKFAVRAEEPPDHIKDLAAVGARFIFRGVEDFNAWSKKMVEAIGESIKPDLKKAFIEAHKLSVQKYAEVNAEVPQDTLGKLKARAADGESPNKMHAYLDSLALDLIKSGTKEREPLIDALHKQVEQAYPDITREQVRDILSNRGKFTPLNPDADATTLRIIKQESIKAGNLEDLMKGKMPGKTGREHQAPSDETRAFQKQINAKMKEMGIEATSPETQLKSALASKKTRMKNEISDLRTEIETGKRLVKGEYKNLTDAEVEELATQLAQVRKDHAEIFQKPGLTDAQRLAIATKAAQKSLENWTKRRDDALNGAFKKTDKKAALTSPEIEAIKANRDAAKKEVQQLERLANPPKTASERLAEQLGKNIKALEERIASGKIEPVGAKQGPDTAAVTAAKAKIKELNTTLAQLRKAANPPMGQVKALEKYIAKLQEKIRTGDTSTKPPKQGPDTAAVAALKVQRDALSKQLADLRDKDPVLRAQRQVDAADRTVTEYERKLAAGEFTKANGTPPTIPPEVKTARDQAAAARKQYETARNADPDYQLQAQQAANDAYRTNLARKAADIADRKAKGDYGPRTKPSKLVLDDESLKAQAKYQREVNAWEDYKAKMKLANRPKWVKGADALVDFVRAGAVSSLDVASKISGAGLIHMATSPIKESIALAAHNVPGGIGRFAKAAPREGGFESFGSMAKAHIAAYTAIWRKGILTGSLPSEFWERLKTGKSDRDTLYGRHYPQAKSLAAYVYHLHAALSTPTARFEAALAIQKLSEYYDKQGADISSPIVQMRINTEALKSERRSLFREDNQVADAVSNAMKSPGQPNKETGAISPVGKAISSIAQAEVPVVHLALNSAAQTLDTALGSVRAGAVLTKALVDGFRETAPKVDPAYADSVMRSLKRGSLGAAMLAMGFFALSGAVGGLFMSDEDQKKSGIPAGSVRIFGHNILPSLLKSPLVTALQLGASMRHVADSFRKKNDTEPRGVGEAMIAAAVGILDTLPGVPLIKTISDIMDKNTRDKALDRNITGMVVPKIVSQAASATDSHQRKPQNLKENLEAAIPGLRQNVPAQDQTLSTIAPKPKVSNPDRAAKEGPLLDEPMASAIGIYDRMNAADKAKYQSVMADKIANSALTANEKETIMKDHGISPPANMPTLHFMDEQKPAIIDQFRAGQRGSANAALIKAVGKGIISAAQRDSIINEAEYSSDDIYKLSKQNAADAVDAFAKLTPPQRNAVAKSSPSGNTTVRAMVRLKVMNKNTTLTAPERAALLAKFNAIK